MDIATLDIVDKNFDLYEVINGKWEREFDLPPHESEWGTFRQISFEVEQRLKDILNENRESGEHAYLQEMYQSIMNLKPDTDRLEAQNLVSMLSLLEPERYRNNREALGHVIALLEVYMANPLFSVNASEDPKDTSNVRLTLAFPNLTLPDKIYYEDSSYSDYVEAFKVHAQNVLSIYSDLIDQKIPFLSEPNVGEDVVMIETLIADSVRTAEEKRNMESFYTRMPHSSFIENITMCKVQDSFDCDKAKKLWQTYFDSAYANLIPELQKYYSKTEAKCPEEIVVYDTPYFQKLTKILMTQPVEKICRYLAYHLISGLSMPMIRAFDDTYDSFISIKLNGQKEPSPRDDRTLRVVDQMLGEFLGKEYIERHFDERSKGIVIDMTERIKKHMKTSIETNDWMESNTKEAALLKLTTMNVKIGYPDAYEDRDYMVSGIETRLENYREKKIGLVSIMIYIRVCYFAQDVLGRIDTNKDSNRWAMNPQDVNAYYSPQMNEIVFPAGILSAPIFDPDQDPAQNYGGIGSVIAHEITHGFDDQGRKYDHDGNINNWWSENDLASFKSRVRMMIDQYEKYEIEVKSDTGSTWMNVNGGLTLGENIADLGGVTLSYRALEDELKDKNQDITRGDKKKFFEAYALLWRRKVSPTKVVARILSDPHSPNRYRVWIVRNIDSFLDTYGLSSGHIMYLEPENRVRIY